MLQTSDSNVSSVFLDICCKCIYMEVAYVSRICCKCFYLDVAYVLQMFQVFLQVFQMHVSNILFVFRCMLYLLHLDVSKLDRVLNLSPSPFCCFASAKRGKAEVVPTGIGGPHVLASVVDEMWAGKRGTWDWGSGAGVRTSGR
jgi:hypothetical protein